MLARNICELCEKKICNKDNSLFFIGCSESFHKKCLKLTPQNFNLFHVNKKILFVDCAFKNHPFNQSSDCS